jgi:MOSC domain-containing protein YiiM
VVSIGGAGTVVAVHRDTRHRFSKATEPSIRLLAGLGVEGDAHAGATVQHRSRKRWRPDAPNLRQVHLLQSELFAEVAADGFEVAPGDLGENVTTSGVDLLGLPRGTRFRLGAEAVVEVTGLRSPCVQIDRFRPGLQAAVVDRDAAGDLVRRTGVMAVVAVAGVVAADDPVVVVLPDGPHRSLVPV